MAAAQRSLPLGRTLTAAKASKDSDLVYIINKALSIEHECWIIEVGVRRVKTGGNDFEVLPYSPAPSVDAAGVQAGVDHEILPLLFNLRHVGASPDLSAKPPPISGDPFGSCRFELDWSAASRLVRSMCQTGRCVLRRSLNEPLAPLTWDDHPWDFAVCDQTHGDGQEILLRGVLHKPGEQVPLSQMEVPFPGGITIVKNCVCELRVGEAVEWFDLFLQCDNLRVPVDKKRSLTTAPLDMPRRPPLLSTTQLWNTLEIKPRPSLCIRADPSIKREFLRAELFFEYGEHRVADSAPGREILCRNDQTVIRRDTETENLAREKLRKCGMQVCRPRQSSNLENTWLLGQNQFSGVVCTLCESGWRVEADGKIVRPLQVARQSIRSGIDWLELRGDVGFEGTSIALPELLRSIQKGMNTVRLGDGTFGVLPEEWLARFRLFAELGIFAGDALRFERSKLSLLDALLSHVPETTWDAASAKARDELQTFKEIKPVDPPPSFAGTLRPYQRIGLGWLGFLERFGFGGCLADDMGLGKTIQGLAMLEAHRSSQSQSLGAPAAQNTGHGQKCCSIVVTPRSLVFNWKQEAARFTPKLRVFDYTGKRGTNESSIFGEYDVLLTTYGTLRRRIAFLKEAHFNYAILDEAQAIKNASTATSKAARLLRADHRLALSGTPIENHLGELWSLLEFLNPGMLGGASALKMGAKNGAKGVDESTRQLLAKALRPFILRRTKEQVAKDLPAMTEQTIYCDMEADQRRMYNELREHYRQSLLSHVQRAGINKSKIQILQALLRLRQAACHPGLIDKKRTAEPCAKLDVLLPRVKEVVDEGHKALVFSQFTSLLSIVKPPLDAQNVAYEYLDGKTRDRAVKVDRFQNDPACRLFLISLKAGGLGLNLTAADYVFLLDPWWNPAVESQAIARAHRIGQTRQVFAYRLIARDTVEEKILELQKSKRELSDSIIRADNGLIRTLKREDLELLLS